MTSSRWSEPLTQTETKGETQMELSACIVVYNGAQEAIKAAQRSEEASCRERV